MEIIGTICFLPYQLELVEVLEYFDGDLLRYYIDRKQDKVFIEKWADTNLNKDRFLFFETSQKDIDDYLDKKLCLLDLILRGSNYYLNDHYKKSNLIDSFKIYQSQIPKSYLPSPEAFHDESLRYHY